MSRMVPAPDALVGKRFDVAVAKMLGISRSKAADLVDSGQARVLGREVARSSTLQAGETVEFDLAEEQAGPEPIATDMAVVYEDDDVVVVDKPVGVAAHASVGWTGPTVLGSLRDRGVHIASYGAAGREGIVSRLDVGTSGLMLVCKSDLAYTEMRRQFAEHEVKKTYHALVQGGLKENKATIEAPIGRAKVSDFRFCVTPAGKPAVTHWDVLERFGHEATLVSVNLETGRTHQIRVHFSSIGHPLCGDPMYGANPVLSEAFLAPASGPRSGPSTRPTWLPPSMPCVPDISNPLNLPNMPKFWWTNSATCASCVLIFRFSSGFAGFIPE